MRTSRNLSCPGSLLSFIRRMPRSFPCSIGWTVYPPRRKINAAFVSSGCRICAPSGSRLLKRRHLRAPSRASRNELPHTLFLSRQSCRGPCPWPSQRARSTAARDRRGDSEKTEIRIEPGAAHLQGGVIMQRKKRKAATDAVEILHRRYYHGKPGRLAAL